MSVLRIDLSSGLPIYAQLKAQVKELIARGHLRPGDRLPPVRELAIDLRVNHLTIRQAYEELEAEGIVTMSPGPGRGTVITERSLGLTEAEKERRVMALLRPAVAEGVTLQVSAERLRGLFEAVLAAMPGPGGRAAPSPSEEGP